MSNLLQVAKKAYKKPDYHPQHYMRTLEEYIQPGTLYRAKLDGSLENGRKLHIFDSSDPCMYQTGLLVGGLVELV
ncbi:hypothetical protein EYZ11_009886 [Aspergillus tanneri]|uniref:Uncharacterized protein n=1 Tax=Aspergillus tanneri TaxID=1220188 RepID=A0A4S3J769_9EURO|nr:hypothetical protein EYZ11_009886 [Aspergillus tanneri]